MNDIVLAAPFPVELMRTGQYPISTGTFDFTPKDLRAAVDALDCPAVRRPVLKLGHTDPRFDGEPAVGYVDNMRVENDGVSLYGDFTGMPSWLGNGVLASAYPDRSIEGQYDFTCQKGHVHDFVLTAVALLGVTAPGIGTLQSLQDVQALYAGVAASAPEFGNGVPVTLGSSRPGEGVVHVDAAKVSVAAAVSAEDVRRAYYAKLDAAGDWDHYLEELQLDPPQLIVVSDRDNTRARIPLTIDGDNVEFGDPVPVRIQYEDVTVAASNRLSRVPFTREDRPKRAAATGDPAYVPPADSLTTDTGHESGEPTLEDDAMADSLRDALVTMLGLPADVSDEALNEAVEARLTVPAALPEGTVPVDQARLDQLVSAAAAVEEFREERRAEKRDRLVAAAIEDGKITPDRRDHYAAAYDRDPEGVAKFFSDTPRGLMVPVAAAGYSGAADQPQDDKTADDEFATLYGLKELS